MKQDLRRYTKEFPPLPPGRSLGLFVVGCLLRTLFGALRRTLRFEAISFDAVGTVGRDRPVIFFTWHKFTIPMCLAAASNTRFRDVHVVFHDRFNSYMWIGSGGLGNLRPLVFSFRSRKSPTEQIAEILSPGMRIATHPDSGGPYEKMKPGLVKIAKATGAALVPIVSVCSKEWRLGSPPDHRVPKPGARVELFVGDPVDLEGTTLEGATQRAEDALVDLVRRHEAIAP